jgi:hypothetical protein
MEALCACVRVGVGVGVGVGACACVTPESLAAALSDGVAVCVDGGVPIRRHEELTRARGVRILSRGTIQIRK